MKILYYLSSFPKLSQSFVLNEIYELERRGHDIAVCALWEPDEQITHEEFAALDAPVYYVGELSAADALGLFSRDVLHPSVLREAQYRAPLATHVANLLRAERCIDFVDSLDWVPDHVHSHFATRLQYGGRLVASRLGVPFTVTVHAGEIYGEPIHAATPALLRSADRIVTISEYNRRHIREQYTDDVPIDIVRAGIRPEKFEPSSSVVDNRIVTVARLVEKKGLRYALEAVARIAERIPDVEYHLIGSGELETDLRRLTRDLDLQEHVRFLNSVSDERLHQELDEAACFLLPCVVTESGDRDGIPVALMEAMAMETPPVSTSVSGIPELVDDGENGLLVEPRNDEELAAVVFDLLSDGAVRSVYGEKAREKVVTTFNITTEASVLESTLESAGQPNVDG